MSAPPTNSNAPSAADTELPNVSAFLAAALPCEACLPSLSPSARGSALASTVNKLTEAFLADLTNSLQDSQQTLSLETCHPTHEQPPSHEHESHSHSESTLTDPLVPTDADAQSSRPTLTPAKPHANVKHGKSSRRAPRHAKSDTSKPHKSPATRNPKKATPAVSHAIPRHAPSRPSQLGISSHEEQTSATSKRSRSLSPNEGKARKRPARDTANPPKKGERRDNRPPVPHSDPDVIFVSAHSAPRGDHHAARDRISLIDSNDQTSHSSSGEISPSFAQRVVTMSSQPETLVHTTPRQQKRSSFN